MKKNKLQYQLLITLFSVIIIATLIKVTDVYADPTSLPPTGPIDILLNESNTAQTKTGPLTINANLHGDTINANTINANRLCLSGDCRNVWPVADYSIPNLNTVMSNSGYLSSGSLYLNNSWLVVNGGWRYTFPKPTFVGWVFYKTAGNPNTPFLCGAGWWCPNPAQLRDGAIVGIGRDLWFNPASANFATLTIGTTPN